MKQLDLFESESEAFTQGITELENFFVGGLDKMETLISLWRDEVNYIQCGNPPYNTKRYRELQDLYNKAQELFESLV